jgi:hypothetical protein
VENEKEPGSPSPRLQLQRLEEERQQAERKDFNRLRNFIIKVALRKGLERDRNEMRSWIDDMVNCLWVLDYSYPKDVVSDILKINDDLTHVRYDPISDNDLQAIINTYINCVSDYPDDEIQEVALPSVDKDNIYHDGVWLADSAASTHMGYDDSRMTNVQHITSQVKIGDAK